ncbi:pyridoxal phosphate-dependent transferase [Hypoxylon sp. FL0890]|nr:pyridoxal phosphate-dependent transferase [Hypoxylon sp. FL0890]
MVLETIADDHVDALIQTPDSSPVIYNNADQEVLQNRVSRYLLNYGIKFIPDIICGSKGLYVRRENGNEVLDWTSGQMSCLLRHGHPEIVKTIAEHAANLDHLFSGMVSPPVMSLSERLYSLLLLGLDKACFLSTGGESNEASIKLAKVVRYHYGRKGQGPLMPVMHMLPTPNAYRSIFREPDGSHDWETELDCGWSLIDQASCGSLAAVILESIQSSAGIHVLPYGYLKALEKHCERRGMLLIVDQAQTGSDAAAT